MKWLSGQNVHGTNDLHRLVGFVLDKLVALHVVLECPHMWATFDRGDVSITRADCTFAYGYGAVVLATGEASGTVAQALGRAASDIGAQIAPGVPSLRPVGEGPEIVLKSGYFGSLDFLDKTLDASSERRCQTSLRTSSSPSLPTRSL